MNVAILNESIKYFEMLHRNIERKGGKPPFEEVIALEVLKDKRQTMLGRRVGA